MSEVYELQAEARTNLGKGHSRRMRRLKDKIPAVIYGAGKEAQSITLSHSQVLKAIENEAFYSHILTLDVAGKKEKAVLKDMQRHAFKPKVLHMDFLRISAKDKITMHVPLHFVGEESAPGVKLDGGIISHLESSVEISCLPADLPEYIEVDVSELKLDESIHLSDLKVSKKLELLSLTHEDDKAVASIHLPRAAVEEDAEEEAETEIKAEDASADESEDKDEDKA